MSPSKTIALLAAVLGAACQPHDATVGAVGLDASARSVDASATSLDAPVTFGGLHGDYFNALEFDSLKGTFEDASLDFPADILRPILMERGIDPITFSVRWRGQIRLRYSEVYTLTLAHTGRARLWVGDKLVIDAWVEHADIIESAGMTTGLGGGEWYDLKVEWDVAEASPNIRLWYESRSQVGAIVPDDDFRHYAGQ